MYGGALHLALLGVDTLTNLLEVRYDELIFLSQKVAKMLSEEEKKRSGVGMGIFSRIVPL